MIFLGLNAAFLVAAAFGGPPDNGFRLFTVILLAIPTLLFFWVKSVRISLHDDGLTYRSIFGEKECAGTRSSVSNTGRSSSE
jgi:hypothetical protein